MVPFFRFDPDLVVFVELQPSDGEFFYLQAGDTEEPLFNTLMELISFSPSSRVYGLEQLCDRGVVVFDATYQRVQPITDDDRPLCAILDMYTGVLRTRRGDPPAVIGMPNILSQIESLMAEGGVDLVPPALRVPYPNGDNRREFLRLAREALGERTLRLRATRTR
jgi:hypothetical protein